MLRPRRALQQRRDRDQTAGPGARLWGSAVLCLPILLVAVGLQSGCIPVKSAKTRSADTTVVRRDTRVVHEPCNTGSPGAEKLDANGDGRADITIVHSAGRELCRAVDLNFDGLVDAWVYFDEQGKPRRREYAYGRDGRVVEIRLYKGGQLAQMQRATTLGGNLDTWHFYQGGRLARTERDSDGNGTIDQWWEYRHAGDPTCPLIRADLDGDGRPDLGATVDVCKETGYSPPDRADRHRYRSPDFSRPGSMPTEAGGTDAEPGVEPEKPGAQSRQPDDKAGKQGASQTQQARRPKQEGLQEGSEASQPSKREGGP
jgi:hypothetical protein